MCITSVMGYYLFNSFSDEFFMNTIIRMDVPITLEPFLILESVEQAQAGVYFEVNALLSEVRTHVRQLTSLVFGKIYTL